MNKLKKKQLKVFYLPNEVDESDIQVGPRKAFLKMLEEKDLKDLRIFSFFREWTALGSIEKTLERVYVEVCDFSPDVIIWQHIDFFTAPTLFLKKLKSIPSQPKLVYHEADPYHSFFKPMNKNMQMILAETDLAFMCGLGNFSRLATKAGAAKVRYLPHSFDDSRVGSPWEPALSREFDLVMIANPIKSKIPGVIYPGSDKRIEVARKVSKKFGKKFALWGKGWGNLISAKGYLPYDQQEKAIRSAWISINWDHFDRVPYYFSDRLPISIATGVCHITCYHPGYEDIFKKCEGGLYFAKKPDEVIDIAEYLLSLPRKQLIEEGQKAGEFAFSYMEAKVVYRRMMEVILEELF